MRATVTYGAGGVRAEDVPDADVGGAEGPLTVDRPTRPRRCVHPRSPLAAIAVVAVGLLAALLPAGPAAAHHSWDEYETRTAYYVTGTLTEVRWGNPHVMVTLRPEDADLPEDWLDRELPEGLEEIGGLDTIASARPYDGRHGELEIELAPIESLAGWGLDRELEPGERVEAVGFLHRGDDGHLRAETIWVDGGEPIRQRLLSLPDRPEPASEGLADAAAGRPPEGPSSSRTWSLVAGAVVASVAAGCYYLKRSYSRD